MLISRTCSRNGAAHASNTSVRPGRAPGWPVARSGRGRRRTPRCRSPPGRCQTGCARRAAEPGVRVGLGQARAGRRVSRPARLREVVRARGARAAFAAQRRRPPGGRAGRACPLLPATGSPCTTWKPPPKGSGAVVGAAWVRLAVPASGRGAARANTLRLGPAQGHLSPHYRRAAPHPAAHAVVDKVLVAPAARGARLSALPCRDARQPRRARPRPKGKHRAALLIRHFTPLKQRLEAGALRHWLAHQ